MSTSITPASPGQITTTACPAESGAVPFLAAIAVNVVVLAVKAKRRYAVDHGRAPPTTTHKSGQYEEGHPRERSHLVRPC